MKKLLPPLFLMLGLYAPGDAAFAASLPKKITLPANFEWCADTTRIRQMLCLSPEFTAFFATPVPEGRVLEPADIVTPADAPKGYREQIMILQ